jgi:hypothetical protein
MIADKGRNVASLLVASAVGIAAWGIHHASGDEKATADNGSSKDVRADHPAPDNAKLGTWVEQRVQAWQPVKDERRFDQIGWTKDIRDAERLAKDHGRPVFLFTHDGRMAVGRC